MIPLAERAKALAALAGLGTPLAETGSIAGGNRWTGRPHQHQREIARRQRQERRS